MKSLILITVDRVVSALMIAFSLYLLLRGHNQPGGGFVGGLVAASAYVVYAYANGPVVARRALPLNPRLITMVGLAIALAAGFLAAVAGAPFLTGLWTFPVGLPIGTPLLFDVGVYLMVVGAVVTLFQALQEEG